MGTWEDLGHIYQNSWLGHLVGAGGGGKISQTPNANPPSSGGSPGVLGGNINDIISQYASAYGQQVDPNQISKFIAATDPTLFSKAQKDPGTADLRNYLSQYATRAGWQPPGTQSAGSSSGGSVFDPIAVQAFFQTTMAPYLSQVAADEKSAQSKLQNFTPIPGLPASYNAELQAGQRRQAQDMGMLYDATNTASAIGPEESRIMSMLQAVQKAKLQDYYAQQRGTGSSTVDLPHS